MKTLYEARNIIRNSKRYEFVDGDNGCTVLVITDYYSGEEVRLDLSNIDQDILDALQVEEEDEQEEYYFD